MFGDINTAHSSVNKRDSLGLGIPALRVKSLSFESKSVETDPEASRPSPVKFTSVPPQLQLEHARYNMEKAKLLSVTEPQLAADTDAEVSSITGSGAGPHLTSRHITPQVEQHNKCLLPHLLQVIIIIMCADVPGFRQRQHEPNHIQNVRGGRELRPGQVHRGRGPPQQGDRVSARDQGDRWTSNDMDCGIMIMTFPR